MNNQNPISNSTLPTENIPVQPIRQPTPSSPKSFFSTKIILLIVFLLIILGVGGTYLALNPKPKSQQAVQNNPAPTTAPIPTTYPTANWKIYQGQGYSVKYPENWIAGENGQGCGIGIHIYPGTPLTTQYTPIQKTCPPSDTIFIYFEDNPSNLSTEQFIKQKGGTIDNLSSITVSNILSQKEIDAPGTVTNVNVYVPFGGKIYTIRWLQGSSAISEQTFNQILSTFKFTQ